MNSDDCRTNKELLFRNTTHDHFSVLNQTSCVVSSRLPVLTEAVRLLSDPQLGKGDAELVQRAGWKLLPFLVVTAAQPRLASCVARSSIIGQHPLTLNWAEGDRQNRDTAEKLSSAERFKRF